jgi:hypothetical protein
MDDSKGRFVHCLHEKLVGTGNSKDVGLATPTSAEAVSLGAGPV